MTMIYDLTKAVASRDENGLCADRDRDCKRVACHLSCWLHDPTQGICPFLDRRDK